VVFVWQFWQVGGGTSGAFFLARLSAIDTSFGDVDPSPEAVPDVFDNVVVIGTLFEGLDELSVFNGLPPPSTASSENSDEDEFGVLPASFVDSPVNSELDRELGIAKEEPAGCNWTSSDDNIEFSEQFAVSFDI
jgi:hypothetical protein